jgi:hypothetical protein
VKIEGVKPDGRSWKASTLKVAVAHGLGNAQKVIDRIRAARSAYHFVEVMTCPGGCIGGGGQPRSRPTPCARRASPPSTARTRASELRKSHENPDVALSSTPSSSAAAGREVAPLCCTHDDEVDSGFSFSRRHQATTPARSAVPVIISTSVSERPGPRLPPRSADDLAEDERRRLLRQATRPGGPAGQSRANCSGGV